MDLPSPLAWLVDEAGASPGPDRCLPGRGRGFLAGALPLAGGALTLSIPHPIIARRTWLWRAETGAVIEALDFAGSSLTKAAGDWLAGLEPIYEGKIGRGSDNPILGWARSRSFTPSETERLDEA